MLLLESIETIGAIWFVMSGIAFIVVAALVKTRRKSAVSTVSAFSSDKHRQLGDRIAKTRKTPVSDKAPARKAA